MDNVITTRDPPCATLALAVLGELCRSVSVSLLKVAA